MRALSRGEALGVVLLCALVGCASCRYMGNRPHCREHADAASCAGDRLCFPVFRCDKDTALALRCSADCTPYPGGSCWVNVPHPSDGCMPDYTGGSFKGCIATDKDPRRCEAVRDAKGVMGCLDHNPPCGGCRQNLSYCDAYGRAVCC